MTERRPDRTLGAGHDEFWAWCDRGELRIQNCNACNRLAWPVVQACEYCGGGEFSWQPMSGRGKIVSWCAFEHDYYQGMLPTPYDTILVELEEGPLFVSNPQGLAWDDIELNKAVKLAFLECEDVSGRFRLPVFAPA